MPTDRVKSLSGCVLQSFFAAILAQEPGHLTLERGSFRRLAQDAGFAPMEDEATNGQKASGRHPTACRICLEGGVQLWAALATLQRKAHLFEHVTKSRFQVSNLGFSALGQNIIRATSLEPQEPTDDPKGLQPTSARHRKTAPVMMTPAVRHKVDRTTTLKERVHNDWVEVPLHSGRLNPQVMSVVIERVKETASAPPNGTDFAHFLEQRLETRVRTAAVMIIQVFAPNVDQKPTISFTAPTQVWGCDFTCNFEKQIGETMVQCRVPRETSPTHSFLVGGCRPRWRRMRTRAGCRSTRRSTGPWSARRRIRAGSTCRSSCRRRSERWPTRTG